MKIRAVRVNNRRKAFEVTAGRQRLVFPFSKLEVQPSSDDPIWTVHVDREMGSEGFTYALRSGREGTVHIEEVLEYNQDPDHRRLKTSPTQLYRLLDQTNYRKSVDQMLRLLAVLDCDVELLVRTRGA